MPRALYATAVVVVQNHPPVGKPCFNHSVEIHNQRRRLQQTLQAIGILEHQIFLAFVDPILAGC